MIRVIKSRCGCGSPAPWPGWCVTWPVATASSSRTTTTTTTSSSTSARPEPEPRRKKGLWSSSLPPSPPFPCATACVGRLPRTAAAGSDGIIKAKRFVRHAPGLGMDERTADDRRTAQARERLESLETSSDEDDDGGRTGLKKTASGGSLFDDLAAWWDDLDMEAWVKTALDDMESLLTGSQTLKQVALCPGADWQVRLRSYSSLR